MEAAGVGATLSVKLGAEKSSGSTSEAIAPASKCSMATKKASKAASVLAPLLMFAMMRFKEDPALKVLEDPKLPRDIVDVRAWSPYTQGGRLATTDSQEPYHSQMVAILAHRFVTSQQRDLCTSSATCDGEFSCPGIRRPWNHSPHLPVHLTRSCTTCVLLQGIGTLLTSRPQSSLKESSTAQLYCSDSTAIICIPSPSQIL